MQVKKSCNHAEGSGALFLGWSMHQLCSQSNCGCSWVGFWQLGSADEPGQMELEMLSNNTQHDSVNFK